MQSKTVYLYAIQCQIGNVDIKSRELRKTFQKNAAP